MTFKKENYTTTLEKAKLLVPGFREAYARMNERMVLDQCSKSIKKSYWLFKKQKIKAEK